LYDSAAIVLWDDTFDVDDDFNWGAEVMSDIDSDDSNAEGFYANSYPDEDSCDDDLSHEGGSVMAGEDDDGNDMDRLHDDDFEELSSTDEVDEYENAPVAFGRFL
jgi:hypothetical protein